MSGNINYWEISQHKRLNGHILCRAAEVREQVKAVRLTHRIGPENILCTSVFLSQQIKPGLLCLCA